ncbi:MAG: hypothetical protein GXP48_02780 [Acidobacteria bacterium]|nr:hypothetical protein [Acidobacteriota bacterium]
MSGPVWRYEKCESCLCDECLRQVDAAYVLGTINDAEFHRGRTLCEDCYRTNIELMTHRQRQDL